MARKRTTTSDQREQLPTPGIGRLPVPRGYHAFLKDLKERIRSTQLWKPATPPSAVSALTGWKPGPTYSAPGWSKSPTAASGSVAAASHYSAPDETQARRLVHRSLHRRATAKERIGVSLPLPGVYRPLELVPLALDH